MCRTSNEKELILDLKLQSTSKLNGVDSKDNVVMMIIEATGNNGNLWTWQDATKSLKGKSDY